MVSLIGEPRVEDEMSKALEIFDLALLTHSDGGKTLMPLPRSQDSSTGCVIKCDVKIIRMASV